MAALFNAILTEPLFNLLVVLYKYVTFNDLGLAIIGLTLVVRFVLYPVFYRGLKSQMLMQQIQPEAQRIQHEHKNDKEKQAAALLALYREKKVNPFGSILYVLIQLPILIAVYRIFLRGLTAETLTGLYSFIAPPLTLNHDLLGLIDMTKPSMLIVIIAVIVQYLQGKTAMVKQQGGSQAAMNKYMVYVGPLLTLLILPRLSAGIGLYWITSAVFSIGQQYLINKQLQRHDGTPERKN